jgi:hypothetical protein
MAENELVIYSPNQLDLRAHVNKLEVPISEINPENRIITDNGIYAGGFKRLKFDEYGVICLQYIRFLSKLEQEVINEKNSSYLLEKISANLFGKDKIKKIKLDNNKIIQHNNINYFEKWEIANGSSIILSYNHYQKKLDINDFFTGLKSEALERQNVTISNEFLMNLFLPLIISLKQSYFEFREF